MNDTAEVYLWGTRIGIIHFKNGKWAVVVIKLDGEKLIEEGAKP